VQDGEQALTEAAPADRFLDVSRSSLLLALTLPAIAAAFLCAGTVPAVANFLVCNKTAYAAAVALGSYDGKAWGSSGWWKIAPGDCSILLRGPLISRYYYVYAEHEEIGGAWDGDRSFCVTKGEFSIAGRSDCLAKGYETRRFFQVDTGSALRWTENLAD
jgi:uncharacterized membrane protein